MKSSESDCAATPRLLVAGRDESRDLLPTLRRRAAARPDPRGLGVRIERERPWVRALHGRNEEDTLEAMLRALEARCAVDVQDYPGAPARGRVAGLVRRVVEALCRPLVAWMCFRQNAVHRQLLFLLRRERDQRLAQGEVTREG